MMAVQAAKRAPSLWLKYDYKEAGDILVQDVLVPSSGLAKCTYYCCLNWNSGVEGGGYCGIQDHPDGRAFIFSLWDPLKVKDTPITALSKGPGTWTDRFSGEGTGLKSMNFDLGWKENQWYTMVVRRWDSPDGKSTRFGCWVHDQSAGVWTHLITMEYPVPAVCFSGLTVSFLEDWGFTCENYRCVQYKDGFKRSLDKQWIPFKETKFEVNMYDVKNGTATQNYDASCQNPKDGVCIAAGSNIQGNTGTCCTFTNGIIGCQPKKQPIGWVDAGVDGVLVSWLLAELGCPQFRFKVMVGDGEVCCGEGEAITGVQLSSALIEHARRDSLPLLVELEDVLGNCTVKSTSVE